MRVAVPQNRPLGVSLDTMHFLRDFKNFEFAELNLFKPVTVLIGKNASGKTNAIEAVELLSNLANGRALHEITDVGRGAGGFEIRGGLVSCARVGKSRFTLGFGGSIPFFGERQSFTYSVSVDVKPETRICAESLNVGGRAIFQAELQTQARGALLRVLYDNFARGGNKPTIQTPTDRTVLSRYRTVIAEADASRADRYTESRRVVTQLTEYMQSSFVFDPNPRAMRSYERVGQATLLKNGANLSAVLYDLASRDESSKAVLVRLLETIKQLPEEPYQKFGFAVTSQGDVLFGLSGAVDTELMDARVLSDGTLRGLAVLAALETVPEKSRIVIEEFDNGIHPTRVGVLTDALWQCSKRRNLNVLVTTHNPATLDVLTAEQLKSVVLCVLDANSKAARLVPLMSIPDFDVLLESGNLGNLVTRRVLESHLIPNFSEAQKKLAQEWLQSLK
jgi:predicted ATPase